MFHFEVFEFVKRGRGRPKIYNEPRPYIPTGKPRGPAPKTEPDARDLQMREWFLDGKTLQEIADFQEPPISRERVRQLLKKYFGITKIDGGKFVNCTPKKIANEIELKNKRQDRLTARYAVHFLCNRDDFIKYQGKDWSQTERKEGARGNFANAYFEQRNNAKLRNIGWDITFPEWCEIWLSSGRWELRGRGKGYCMTKIGDTGPYSKDNVEIKTIGQNFSDSFLKHSQADRRAKAAANGKHIIGVLQTHCKRGHELSGDNIAIFSSGRQCKACRKIRYLKYYTKKKSEKEQIA